ncbi:MAG: Calcium-binding EF-h [Proteobacteria bacterium]|nr:Calcium-binding EF-h [Pseudomonadota bacterium]
MLSGINQATQMASLLFSKLDTKNQGYLEQSDLTSAFSQIVTNASDKTSSTSAEDVFTALDTDSDGKVTKDEFATVLAQLQEQLGSQFGHGQAHGAGGGMAPPPPPPPGDDAGFTKEELTSQLESADSTDTQRTSLISNIVNNFEAADTDGDGKVSFAEAMAYDQSTQAASDTGTTASASSTTASNGDAQLMKMIMQLVNAYRVGDTAEDSGTASLLSVSA